MPRLSLFLLGMPRLELDDLPLELNSRKTLALLAYLALTRQAHSRDVLATLLWPDSDQAKARAALRSALWALTKATGPNWLEIGRETVSLAETESLWVDVRQFSSHLAACQTHGHPAAEVCPDCLPRLAEAVKLYRDKFMASFSLRDSPQFDEWQFFESERLNREFVGALEGLAQGYSNQGEFEPALTYAWHWLETDPLDETVHRRLMQLYAWRGQPAMALRQYHECVQLLQKELGAPPSAATTQLYQAIKENRFLAPPSSGFKVQGPEYSLSRVEGLTLDTVSSIPSVPTPEPLEAEQRKQVTLLSVDLSEFVASAESFEPEEINEFMHMVWDWLRTVAANYGGYLDKQLGEVASILFGTPVAREDDPERAVRVALALQAELSLLVKKVECLAGSSPQLRIGVDTGPILLKLTQPGERYTAVGGTVHLARRLSQAAPPGSIFISQQVYPHIRGLFELQQVDPILMKGRPEPVQVYQVQSARPRSFQAPNRGIEGLETRMIGREGELRQLQEALYASLEDNESQVVTVIGEAGIGKSRLLAEFNGWLGQRPEKLRIFRGRADPQMSQLPYALSRDLFTSHFQSQDNDGAAVGRTKLEQEITGVMGADHLEKAHFIGQLLGFDFSDSPYLRDVLEDTWQLHDRAFHYLARFFTLLAKKQPVVILLEDLHWADQASLDLIDYLTRSCRQAPLMVVGLARPSFRERRPLWGEGQAFHTRLPLRPLSKRESRRLLAEILRQILEIPLDLQELLVNTTEGNPFYMEELVKALIEEGVILTGSAQWEVDIKRLAEVRVPQTLVGVLQARLDRLPPPARETLQWSAIVGQVFWDKAIIRLQTEQYGQPLYNIEDALTILQERGMIFSRQASSFAGAQEYVFSHTVLHEVTYETVLKRQRRHYHIWVAGWLTEQSREQIEAYAGLIGEHYERAGDIVQAANWYALAGRQV